MKRITHDAKSSPTDIKRYAALWFAGLAVGNLALTLIAIAALMNGVPGLAALVLCAQIFIPGLAFTKWLEIGNMWRGYTFDGSKPETENSTALPGFLALVLAGGVLWLLIITGLPGLQPT